MNPWHRPSRRESLLAEPWPDAWEIWLTQNFKHYPLLSDAQRARVRQDCRIIVAEKTWEGCDGLKVTDIMKVTIAAQAALLLLGLEHDYFSRVLSIVVFPTDFELPLESYEARGRIISGQAVDYGSVYLAWDRVLWEGRDPSAGSNLVIHEFAHQLDFLDGYTNGTPALRSAELTRRWQIIMNQSFTLLCREVQNSRDTFLGSYAGTNPTEFFSVVSEKFFLVPMELHRNHPDLYDIMAEYYRVDPGQWFRAKTGA
jgi:MtfA peptidase